MSLKERLDGDLKDAMRNKDSIRRTVLRTIISEIRNAEIAKQEALDDEGVLVVMTKQAQQRRDSIEAFKSASRSDLVESESAELKIISGYLPEQLSEDEIEVVITEVISQVEAKGSSDMGKVMKEIMQRVRGRADGKMVSAIVTSRLKEM
ncbi:MAG: aspartyl-tRNA amidotransferase [Chloroflexi bacterium]|nr:aspartyl-tRNA amidotransferase [Chloroflexota bacterium]MBG91880.1 aspartyl-tRNA amidotransferase [Chloroflexota bacterium]MQG02829.1 GatB/YqeY domain-containing protein [SAR202 cluster bacterium]